MKHCAGRVAVITGAAGGLGRALAHAAAARGMRLVLGDIDAAALERIAGELQAAGSDVLAMVCDVGKASHVEELADAAMIRFHAVHLVFNVARAATRGRVWEYTTADWDRVLGTNLWGAIHAARVFTPLMRDCARRDPGYEGHIVNTAPLAGLLNLPAQGAGDVAQHAVLALTEALYRDLRQVDSPIAASVLCRHAPGEPGMPDDRAERAPAAAADLARITFEAIERGDFYILPYSGPQTHPQTPPTIAARIEAMAQAKPPARS